MYRPSRNLKSATALLSSLLALALAIKVVPNVTMAGGEMKVTCTVPRSGDNRWLEVAIIPYVSETRQLDGEAAYVTHEFYFKHIPCEAQTAVCAVVKRDGKTEQVTRALTVAGCDQ